MTTDKETTHTSTAMADMEKRLPEYKRVREEFEVVARLGKDADIDSAMLNVDALVSALARRAAQPVAPSHWTDERITELSASIASAVAKNASTAHQLCFPHIYLGLKEALATPSPQVAEGAELPPLPEPRAIRAGDAFPKVYALAYTADQMQQYARDAIAASRRAGTLINEGTTPAPASAGQGAMADQIDAAVLRKMLLELDVSPSKVAELRAFFAAQPAEGAGQAGQVACSECGGGSPDHYEGCSKRTERAAAPADLEQQIVAHRIALTPENEGGWHAHVYRDSDTPLARGYGATPGEAVSNATHQPSAQVKP